MCMCLYVYILCINVYVCVNLQLVVNLSWFLMMTLIYGCVR